MGIIRQLPEDIAIKIAAGEVVERPASVLKELVENALDAGATRIEIELHEGGKAGIEIRDNGSGMDRDDASNAFLRHGTSKIQNVDDLMHVTTLGFRGEALAAIAASAEIELVTTLTNATEGTHVTVSHGVMQPARAHAPLTGTRITVKNLFAELPARQKFLKSDATEWKASLETITRQMLTHPEVGFLVKHNDRVVYDLAPQSFLDRVAELWHIPTTELLEVSVDGVHLSLRGVIAKPEVVHAGKSRQFFAVNGHPVNDKMVARSIKDAFGTLLPPGMYPTYALSLQIHPGIVDVNIHPRKDEVRFVNPQDVYRFVFQSISQGLDKKDVAFGTIAPPSFRSPPHEASSPSVPNFSFPSAPTNNKHFAMRTAAPASFFSPALPEETEATPILVVDQCYLIVINDQMLLLIDQHAAHERILYNKLWEADAARNLPQQPLLMPIELVLNPHQEALFQQHKSAFESLGFSFTDSSLTAVPQLIKQKDPSSFFASLLNGLEEDRHEPDLTTFKHKLFATMACKAAVKAGDALSEDEKQRLVTDLLAMPKRFTCPHGRPSHIVLAPGALEKLFKRTGF